GTAAAVGKAVPLIFVLGAIGIALIAHGFFRLTQRYNQAGSAYALVGMTIGPRAGFFSGFGVMVTYLLFAIACLGAIGSFVNAFLANAQGSSLHPFQVPWVYSALGGFVIAAYFVTREFRNVVRLLLAIETIGIISMTILVIVIFAKGGPAHGGGFDLGTFSPKGQSFTVIMGAVVAAFFTWACGARSFFPSPRSCRPLRASWVRRKPRDVYSTRSLATAWDPSSGRSLT